ncbi:MAG: TetR/AcrR family transcriptional regulator [Fusobacterium sp.]|nr:TetR/AcrR family transcriptional regulator [Fusobacterium sp.]
MNKKERKKELILKTFKELTINKGYSNVTVDNIVNACSISKGSFYTYFSSKAEMLGIILDDFHLKSSEYLENLNNEVNDLDKFLKIFLAPPTSISEEQYEIAIFLFSILRNSEILDSENYQKIKNIYATRKKNVKNILLKYENKIKIDKKYLFKYSELLVEIKDNFLCSLFIDYNSKTFRFRNIEEFSKNYQSEETKEHFEFLLLSVKKILN